MMLDPKRTFDELIDRLAPDPQRAEEIKRQPRLPRAVDRRLGLAGVHRDLQALRARPRGRLRPARARHAAVAQRARLPRRPRAADLVPGGAGAEDVHASDGPRDAGARPRRRAGAGGTASRHRRRPAVRPVDLLRAAGRHDRGLHASAPSRSRRCSEPRPRRSCSSPRPSASRSTRRSGSAARSSRAACRSPASSSTASTTTSSATASRPTSPRRWRTSSSPELAARVAENFHDYHVLARRDERNIARLARRARRPPAAAGPPPRRRRPRHRGAAPPPPLPVRLRGRPRADDRRGGGLTRPQPAEGSSGLRVRDESNWRNPTSGWACPDVAGSSRYCWWQVRASRWRQVRPDAVGIVSY